MTAPQGEIDFMALITNVTDSLGPDTPPASSSPTAGFTLHRAVMGRNSVLIKFFSGLPRGCLNYSESQAISKAFLHELGVWKHNFHSNYFVNVIGRSEYIDSILPCPVYEQADLAKEYLKERKDVDILACIHRIAEGLEFIHRKDFVHGDIRADNILVGVDGLPRISDYGLTKIVSLLDHQKCRGKTDVSPAIRWMPPESINLDDEVRYEPTKQGDIWSFGMTIYELWSGNIPYFGTSIERVPLKIRRHQLPEFSMELMPHLERLRENIWFSCKMCWSADPRQRRTAEELVLILNQLVQGKAPSLIEVGIESRVANQASRVRNNGAPFPRGNSTSSSDSVTSETRSIEVGSVNGPSDGSDSGYETVLESDNGTRMDHDGMTSVSEWSHGADPAGRNFAGGNGQANQNIRDTQQAQDRRGRPDASDLRPFSEYPAPPSPNSPLLSVDSWMTALLNYKAKHKLTDLDIKRKSRGDDHQRTFTTSCKIDGQIYSRATDVRKKGADEKAAKEALTRLYNENPSLATEFTPSYLSTFKAYLAEHKLSNRIQLKFDKTGEEHVPVWICVLLRDGREFSRGEATKKRDAEEMAVKNAALSWRNC